MCVCVVMCVCLFLGVSSPICYSYWQSIGPFNVNHMEFGINDLTDPEDIGALHQVVMDGDVAYAGSVNGGVWKTNNLHGKDSYGGPHWYSVTNDMNCASIEAIDMAKTDNRVIVAGCGLP